MNQNVNLFAFFYLLNTVRRSPTSLHCFLRTHSFFWLRALSLCTSSAVGHSGSGYWGVSISANEFSSRDCLVLWKAICGLNLPPPPFNCHPNCFFLLMARALERAVTTICMCLPPFNLLSANLAPSCSISLKLLSKGHWLLLCEPWSFRLLVLPTRCSSLGFHGTKTHALLPASLSISLAFVKFLPSAPALYVMALSSFPGCLLTFCGWSYPTA